VLAECLPGLSNRVKKGDVVICVRPVDASEHIVKRVVATAGEEVVVWRGAPPASSASGAASFSSSSSSSSSASASGRGSSVSGRVGGGGDGAGLLYTGGALAVGGRGGGESESEAASSPAVASRRAFPIRLTVPPGHVWVQGDNLAVSRDSREYGPVPLGTVRGRVLCTVWPRPRPVDAEVSPFGGAGRRPPG
jgi:hypothetical protein